MNTAIKNLSLEEKVSALFDYIFSGVKAEDEERFWNELTATEIDTLEKIRKEDTVSLSELKKEME